MRRTLDSKKVLRWTAMTLSLIVLAVLSGCRHTSADPQRQDLAKLRAGTARIGQAQRQLLSVKTRSMETDVSAEAQRDIADLKVALTDLTDAVVVSLPIDATTVATQQKLSSFVPHDRPTPNSEAVQARAEAEEDAPEAGDFGGDLTFKVIAPSASLLLVDESFGIECGDDHVLLGYSNASGKWSRVLRWQASAYDRVSGAFGDIFETQLLMPNHDGKPALLVVHGTPWCTSTISGFAMDTFVLDPGHETETPFWHGEHGYRRADDVPPYVYSLKKTAEGWEIRASVSDRTDAIARVGVMRYRLTQRSVERVLPIARNARETVEEWLGMPRAEAALFTDAPAGSLTWRMYDTFQYRDKSSDAEVPSMVYGPVRGCTDSARHVQAEIDSTVYETGNHAHHDGPVFFVQLQKTANGYRLQNTSLISAAACTGKPILYGAGYAAR